MFFTMTSLFCHRAHLENLFENGDCTFCSKFFHSVHCIFSTLEDWVSSLIASSIFPFIPHFQYLLCIFWQITPTSLSCFLCILPCEMSFSWYSVYWVMVHLYLGLYQVHVRRQNSVRKCNHLGPIERTDPASVNSSYCTAISFKLQCSILHGISLRLRTF